MNPTLIAALVAARHDDLERTAGCCTARTGHLRDLAYASRQSRRPRGHLGGRAVPACCPA
jgi:hypothetical protein